MPIYPRVEAKIIETKGQIKRLKELKDQISVLSKEIDKIKGKTYFCCGGCSKRTEISKISPEIEMYYSYTDEDWIEGGNNIICPKCNKHTFVDDKVFEKHYFTFKSIIKTERKY